MSPQLRGMGFTGPQQQRGAIGLMAAVTLGMVLLFMLLVIDSGRLYLEQRKLQRVADMAALEVVSRGGTCGSSATAVTYAKESATRNGFTPGSGQTITPTCGTLKTDGATQLRVFTPDQTKSDAIRVIATTTVPTSVAGGLWSIFSKDGFDPATNLTASAVGSNGGSPLAQLTIRSSLVKISSDQSTLLNPLIGGMLGGTLTLDAVSWNGLVDTKISLLSYLNTLLDLNTNIGSTDELLNTNLHLSQLLDALSVSVLKKNGPGADLVIKNLTKLSLLPSSTQLLKLSDLLNIETGTPSAGLNTEMSIFDLLQGVAQLSNGKNAAAVTVNTNVPLVGNIAISVKVIEPPQISAIGNPALAIKRPMVDADQIMVRTAQVQTHVHVDLAILKLVSDLTSTLTSILSPLTNVVNKLLNLDLIGAVGNLLVGDRTSLSLFSSLDIYLDAAGANSYVTDYSCSSNTSKSLTIQASTALVNLSIGSPPLNATFPPKVEINNKTYLAIEPVKLISIDITKCIAAFICSPTQIGAGGGLGLKLQTQVGANSQPITYNSPDSPDALNLKNVGLPPVYKSLNSTKLIESIGNTLDNQLLVSYIPKTANITNDALSTVAGTLHSITSTLASTFKLLLAPLLDPIINTLLQALGINLGNAEIGANLSCGQGGRAQLVL
ncbi:pilus assembly protein TadG-related protein [Pseudomonas kulmbachensis]|uniref:pilus assembly protein TadG-related protein n=1 Tax=Pseudomonas kulmbachensis TaxID=3043408 RepID=UPI002AAFB310|nr:pilus assembly protein TadG-related protein [Pseudomonas sp. FLM 004-28]